MVYRGSVYHTTRTPRSASERNSSPWCIACPGSNSQVPTTSLINLYIHFPDTQTWEEWQVYFKECLRSIVLILSNALKTRVLLREKKHYAIVCTSCLNCPNEVPSSQPNLIKFCIIFYLLVQYTCTLVFQGIPVTKHAVTEFLCWNLVIKCNNKMHDNHVYSAQFTNHTIHNENNRNYCNMLQMQQNKLLREIMLRHHRIYWWKNGWTHTNVSASKPKLEDFPGAKFHLLPACLCCQ